MYGDTPLHVAAYNGQFEVVRFLLEEDDKKPKGSDRLIAQVNRTGWNVVHWAVWGARPGVLAFVLSKAMAMGAAAALLAQTDAYGRQPVHLAAQGRLPKMLEMLLEVGASATAECTHQGARQIPFHFACYNALKGCKELLSGDFKSVEAGQTATGKDLWRAQTAQWLAEN